MNNKDIEIEWLNSNTLLMNPSGTTSVAGTVVRIDNNLIFLKSYSNENLLKLKNTINQAIDYELLNRVKE